MRILSRLIGRFKANDKEYCIRQEQHATVGGETVGGEYEIQDKEKRAEYEAEKEKQIKENNK